VTLRYASAEKKACILFLFVFFIVFVAIASVGVHRVKVNVAVTSSPGVVSATAIDVIGLRNNGLM
jgi:hypothetical protein